MVYLAFAALYFGNLFVEGKSLYGWCVVERGMVSSEIAIQVWEFVHDFLDCRCLCGKA